MATLSLTRDGALSGRQNAASSAHEERVEAFYSRGAKEWFEFKRARGEIPYSTWGLWDAGVTSADQAFGSLIAEIVRRARIGATDSVLDVGCGYGASSIELRKRSGCSAVLGIDLTEAFVVHAGALIADANQHGSVDVRRMSAIQLELPEQSRDVVVAIDCACHFDSREHFLLQAARVLRPGGRLVMLDLLDAEHERGGWLRKLLARYLMSSWNVPAVNRYGAAELRRRLERSGFEHIELEAVTARMLPGAIAAQRAPAFRRDYARAFGRFADVFWQVMLWCIAKIHTWRLGEFVIVSAVRAPLAAGDVSTAAPRPALPVSADGKAQ